MQGSVAYQVMTLSAMGDAETPAGGSVCMRCDRQETSIMPSLSLSLPSWLAYLEVTHQAAASGCRHCQASVSCGICID